VLFDLDGTLVDTAPDLVAVLNTVLREAGRPPMSYAIARNEVSNGAIGLLKLGFGLGPDAPELEPLRSRLLDVYMDNVCIHSRLFIDLQTFLGSADFDGRWGIVTNKPQALTEPLLEQLGIAELPACVISGDSLPQRKPDPAQLLLAAQQLGLAPDQCVYVGDARRDIEAGQAAGMPTVAAAYGYIRAQEDPRLWGADTLIRHPQGLGEALSQLRERGL